MKYLKIILILIFAQNVFGQNPQLIENTWYLQNVIIDDNNNLPPPPNDDFEFIQATFNNNDFFETSVCASLSGELSYNSDQFLFDDFAITLIGCGEQINEEFQNLYINSFFQQTIDNPHTYTINTINSVLELTVVNSNNDMAIYTNELLSIEDFINYDFVIFPNPVKSTIHIENKFQYGTSKIIISDITGKYLNTYAVEGQNITFDISSYQSGVYFVRIVSSNGNVSTSKFFKD
jgi:hypothetical protein